MKVKLTTTGRPEDLVLDALIPPFVTGPPDVLTWGSRVFVPAANQVGDGGELPIVYREAFAVAVVTGADGQLLEHV